MHESKPFGLFGHVDDDIALASRLAASVENQKQLGGLEQLTRTITLPDGRSMSVVLAGDNRRVIIRSPSGEEREIELDEVEQPGIGENIPMLVSGAVTNPRPKNEDGVEIRVTQTTRHRMRGYDTNKPYPAKNQELKRFRVEYPPHASYFKPEETGIYFFSQYDKLHSTWFSGPMREVAQIILGYGGRVTDKEDSELSTIPVPWNVSELMKAQVKKLHPVPYSGVVNKEGQLLYNHTYPTNDAVSFDRSGKPWLLNISHEGVFAMELPIIKGTNTSAFRKYMEDVGDDEVLQILDRFGGMPSGEAFPQGRLRGLWEKAGAIIKICDTEAMRDKFAPYFHCGWSSDTRGRSLFNTAFSYADNGLLTAHSMMLSLNLEPASFGTGWGDPELNTPEINAHLSAVMRAASRQDRGVLQYKFQRVGFSGIGKLALSFDSPGAALDYWLNLELDPIASHWGRMSVTGSGPVYSPGGVLGGDGRLKFPDGLGMGCLSFDMRSPEYHGEAVECDTVVFGYFNGDSLKVVKYFYTEKIPIEGEVSDFEECMAVGTWEKEWWSGRSEIRGRFYTSDFDMRDVVSENRGHTKIVGTDLGYSEPAYFTPEVMFMTGGVGRSRYAKHVEETEIVSGTSLDVAACVPTYQRDAVLYPFTERSERETRRGRVYQKGFSDPNLYELWTWDPIFHYIGSNFGGPYPNGIRREYEGDPKPTIGQYVYVDLHYLSPGHRPCDEFVDQGPFLGGLPMDVTGMLSQYTYRHSPQHTSGAMVGGQFPRIRESSYEEVVLESERHNEMYLDTAGTNVSGKIKTVPSLGYFAWLVDTYLPCRMLANGMGDTLYARLTSGTTTEEFGHSGLANDARCFIGVINE